MTATDAAGNDGTDGTADELTVDLTPPVVTVDPLTTNDTTPELTGTVDDTEAAISVTVAAQTHGAVNNGDGTWTLPDDTLSELSEGTYDVEVTATDAAGNDGTDGTTDELTVDLTPPVVTVDSLLTNDTTPELRGTVDDNSAAVSVTVDTQTHGAVNNGDGTWTLADDTLSGLSDGTYDVEATATDAAGNDAADPTTDELTVDATAPTAVITLDSPTPTSADVIAFSVNFSESVVDFTNDAVTLTGSLAGTAEVSGADAAYTVAVSLADPNADGTVGIGVGGDVTDLAGNPCVEACSELCAVHNWFGFTDQPQGMKRRYVGDSCTFSVQAEHGSSIPSYRWWFDDGAKAVTQVGNSDTLDIDPVALGHAGDYWCELAYDAVSYWSTTATLSVNDHLAITAQPVGGEKIVGESHTFGVGTSGGYLPLTYAWKKHGSTVGNESTYTIPLLLEPDSGLYTVVVCDANSDVCESDPAVLIITLGLPAVGLVGLGILFGVCALGGLAALRRKQ